jgi:hypothetical protein
MRPGTEALATLAAVLSLAGCAGDPAISATTVLNYQQCQGLNPGLTRVDYSAVAGIRGSTLLQMTKPEAPSPAPPADDDLLLVAISRGEQPTPGYALSLEGAERRDGTVVVSVHWKTPESGAVLPQMLTHPCLVVGLVLGQPDPGLTRVEAVDQSGTNLGSLAL